MLNILVIMRFYRAAFCVIGQSIPTPSRELKTLPVVHCGAQNCPYTLGYAARSTVVQKPPYLLVTYASERLLSYFLFLLLHINWYLFGEDHQPQTCWGQPYIATYSPTWHVHVAKITFESWMLLTYCCKEKYIICTCMCMWER
jgi:hypothetical protein